MKPFRSDAIANSRRMPSVRPTGPDARDKFLMGAANAIVQKAGVAVAIARVTGDRCDPGEFRNMSMVELARACLARTGEQPRGHSAREIIGAALRMAPSASYQTTGDFTTLLQNALHKTLQAAYASTADTWSRFCATGTVSDFRPSPRYRIGMFSRLDTLTEAGELKNKAVFDAEKEVIQAATYGNIIGLSRQALISDDLSAFSRVATMLGRAARLSIEVDVYALFAENGGDGPRMSDGNPLFHASHNNVATNPGGPTVGRFDEARQIMAQQRDPWSNDFLDVRPAVWVGPVGLGGEARVINDAEYDPSAANKLQRPNKVRGLVRDVVDTPRLSGAPWYMFADPMVAPAIEVAFLDGEQEPYLEPADGFRVDGVQWKVRHDYGVAAVDWRGVVKNPGV